MSYQEFLASKTLIEKSVGKVEVELDAVNPVLFDFQAQIVTWAVRKGRAAIFANTGLGKTLMQLEWARLMNVPTLIIAPLSVARQTVNEARRLLGLEVEYVRSQPSIVENRLYITNYEMIEHFDAAAFQAVVLDESSILKSINGKTRQLLTDMFAATPYRLCCTATPAPNDIKEIANHSEFLGYKSRGEMLADFFRYSQSGGGESPGDGWKLKSHAVTAFYQWLASWAMAVTKPSDLGDFDDTGYVLPELTVTPVIVDTQYTPEGMLPGFSVAAVSAIEAKRVRKQTVDERLKRTLDLVNSNDAQWILWVGLNDEGDKLEKLIPDSVQVKGSQTPEKKAELLEAWQDGQYRVLITKSSIAGYGMNFQNAHHMAFVGIDYSWESYYQSVRRCWRFGQAYPVNVYIITSNQEEMVLDVLVNKELEAISMIESLIKHTKQFSQEELQNMRNFNFEYQTAENSGEHWDFWLGDSTERMAEIADESVDLSVYSPPFSDLFVYSATPRDVGNCATREEFFEHYRYIIRENYRITKPGRLCCVHVQDLLTYLNSDGYIGKKDFSGDVIEAYQREGWVFWQRFTINKNPQVQATRSKDHRLLFKTLVSDSTKLAGGQADYLLIFKKPGTNKAPVVPDVTSEEWIEWAHPVWNNIRETDVLPVRQAKAGDDEKHMCPLQLPVIERCVRLWSNPDELVFSPFGGIGSEGYEAVRLGRRALLIELKPEYYRVGLQNLEKSENLRTPDLFTWADAQEA